MIPNEETKIKDNQKEMPIPPSSIENALPIAVPIIFQNIALPFNVENDLNIFSKVFVTKNFDLFRSIHCCEVGGLDYIIYGQLPDGDRKELFTSRQHFQCCHCCDDCTIPCFLCEYVCCDRIIFQMDYKRNGVNFYTQGLNVQKGCYCCKCHCCQCNCCQCCCPKTLLFLRENTDPDNPDFNVGIKKGTTLGKTCCCCCCDTTMEYTSQEGMKGHNLRLTCCESCLHSSFCCWCCRCTDVQIIIEGPNGTQTGNIIVPNGMFSKKKEYDSIFYCPRPYYEVNFPPGITSSEKFQIITQVVHLDLLVNLA